MFSFTNVFTKECAGARSKFDTLVTSTIEQNSSWCPQGTVWIISFMSIGTADIYHFARAINHQQLSDCKFVWGKWTMIYKINKIKNKNNLPATRQTSWYTSGKTLKSCLLKSKCYTGIYSSNSVSSLKNQSFYPSLPEFFLDLHCSLWQKTGVAISHSYPSYQRPRAFSSKWLTLNFFFTFSASLFLPCLEIEQFKEARWDAEINKLKRLSSFIIIIFIFILVPTTPFSLYL